MPWSMALHGFLVVFLLFFTLHLLKIQLKDKITFTSYYPCEMFYNLSNEHLGDKLKFVVSPGVILCG